MTIPPRALALAVAIAVSCAIADIRFPITARELRAQGTASVSGQVVAADTGQPLEGATVRAFAFPSPSPLAAGQPGTPFQVTTDAAGRFEIRGLAAGRLNLTAAADGFLTTTYRPGLPSLPPQIQTGQQLTGITLALPKAAAISGVVVDSTGRPIANVEVRVFHRGILTVRRAWLDPRMALQTDAEGRFTARNLQPGEYIVSVPVVTTTLSVGVLAAVRAVPRAEFSTSPIIRALEASRAPMPGPSIDVAETTGVVMTGASGSRPVPSPPAAPGAQTTIYRTTYFPAATTLDAAGIIGLRSGEHRLDANITLQRAPAFRLTGTLRDADGPAAFTGVHLIAEDAAERSIDYDGVTAVTATDASGAFVLENVSPGNYSVKVVLLPVPPGQDNPRMPQAARLTGWASESVRVIDRDVELGAISLTPPITISGRVEFAGRGAMFPAQESRSTVWLAAVDGGMYAPPAAVVIGLDGRFALKGAMRSRYHLWGGTYPGWNVLSITAAGVDITSSPLVVGDRDIDDVRILLTGGLVAMNGLVVDASGRPSAAEVLLFPANYSGWIANGLSSRVMRRVRANGTGAFGTGGVPPGLYLVAALPEGSANDWPDRRLFEAVAAFATPVVLTEGKPASVRLVLGSRR